MGDIESSTREQIGLASERPVWVKGPATVAGAGLQRALGGPRRCHRGEAPPPRAPSAIVVCCPEDAEGVAAEVKEALRGAPGATVVAFGSSPDPELARAALRAGARGFLHAGMPPQQIARAVSVALSGEVVLPRALLNGLAAGDPPDDDLLPALSARQREVLGLVAEGLSNSEVARRLYLSESTIKQHLRKTYQLLGVKNRIQAARVFRGGRQSLPEEGTTGEDFGGAGGVGRRTA